MRVLFQEDVLQLGARGATLEAPEDVEFRNQGFVQAHPRPLERQALAQLVDELRRVSPSHSANGGLGHSGQGGWRWDAAQRLRFLGVPPTHTPDDALVAAGGGKKLLHALQHLMRQIGRGRDPGSIVS
jgi:hypothetical protein